MQTFFASGDVACTLGTAAFCPALDYFGARNIMLTTVGNGILLAGILVNMSSTDTC